MDGYLLSWFLLGALGAFIRYWAFRSPWSRREFGEVTMQDILLTILFLLIGPIGLVIGLICAATERGNAVIFDFRKKEKPIKRW